MCGNNWRKVVLLATSVVGLLFTMFAQADSIDEWAEAKKKRVLRELNDEDVPAAAPGAMGGGIIGEARPALRGVYGAEGHMLARVSYGVSLIEVRVGDKLPRGWTVSEIGPTHVKIAREGEGRLLELMKINTSPVLQPIQPLE